MTLLHCNVRPIERIMDCLRRLFKYIIPSWTYSQYPEGSSAPSSESGPESSPESNQDPTSNTSPPQAIKLSDFRSSVKYDLYGTQNIYVLNPLDYTDEGERHRRLDFFLKNIVPSTTRTEEVGEIRVLSPSYVKDEALGDVESLRNDWQEMTRTPERINFRSVNELASTHKCLRGIWMIMYRPSNREKRDEEWVKVARATVKGELGMYVKVSTRKGSDTDIHDIFTMVFTKNSTDKKEIMNIEGRIRRLGVKGRMAFKPSVHTMLGINADNEWSLKTGIYTSHWDPVRNESVVQDKTK